MSYGSDNDSVKRIDSDKVLRDKALKIASNPRYDGYERGAVFMVYKFFWYEFLLLFLICFSATTHINKFAGSGAMPNQ